MRIGIIGGTGVGRFPLDTPSEDIRIETPWGEALGAVGTLGGREVVVMARHGAGHKISPHRINFRANIAGLHQLGVRAVLATTAVGSLRADLLPGTLVVLDNLIDFCLTRTGKTFFDSAPVHTDVTEPYSAPVRSAVLQAAQASGLSVTDGGTYLCADGPRYETSAEVKLFAAWGADVVGMTAIPEATLAREAGLHYAGISLVTNLGAGISDQPLTHTEVEEAMRDAGPRLVQLLTESVARIELAALPTIGSGAAFAELLKNGVLP